ncbi:MAG: 30S ribosomal protein S20 [Candidatus Melainabacteria bacterium]|nr:30S ribosomal protein S20 [Candidatus Melainabacteria bacterium]
MPKIKSAIKRVEIEERNRLRNRHWKSAVRSARTKVAEGLRGSDDKAADAALNEAYSIIDRAVSKGVLHPNNAARKKSRLAVGLGKS